MPRSVLAAAFTAGLLAAPFAARAADTSVVLDVHHAGCVLCGPIVKSTLAQVRGVSAVAVSQPNGDADVTATITYDPAETLHHGRTAARFAGIVASAHLTDWAALMTQKEALVADMREAKYAALLPEYDTIRYVAGAARFTENGLVAGNERFPSERVVIAVDEFLQPSRPGIFAAGDVTGRDQFVYMAAYGAKLAAENALGGNTKRYDAHAMPEVVFTDPQAARVGLTEAEARARNLAVRTVVLKLDQVLRARAARDTRGLIKLVAEEASLRVLGAQILAPEGGDSIQTALLAIRHGLTVNDLAETLFPYLTTVEGLKLASLGFVKDVAKLSCCAG